MKEAFTMTIPITIPFKRIADLLCSGFEGGSGYWACIEGYRKPKNPRSAFGEEKLYKHIDYPLCGGAVIVSEHEEEGTPKHTLNMAAIKRGLALFPVKAPRHFADWVAERDDAETGDVFLQLCLLGELKYG